MESEKDQLEVYTRSYLQRAAKSFQGLTAVWQSKSRLTKAVLMAGFITLFLTASLFSLLYLRQTPKSAGEKKIAQQKIESKILKNRSGPLYGVSGVILAISRGSNGNKIITMNSNLGRNYQATLDSKTVIYTVTREVTDKEVKTTRVKAGLEELKTGSLIYLESNKDLIQKTEIEPDNIKSIEVYKDGV